MTETFTLPDIGEGLTEADILAWRVAVGDTVEVNQVIVEVETAKAAVELPIPWAGVVTALYAEAGETVDVGRPLISIDTASGGAAPVGAPAAVEKSPAIGSAHEDMIPRLPAHSPETPGDGAGAGDALADGKRQPVLVGYGPRAEGGARSRRRGPATPPPSAQPAFEQPSTAPSAALPPDGPDTAPDPAARMAAAQPQVGAPPPGAVTVLAKPPVRKLAKTLGVDLTTVTPTGPNGTISRDDVEAATTRGALPSTSDNAPRGRETRIPIKGVRKHTAAAMVASAFTAPHVTEFITIDVTATMELRDRVAARREFRDVKVSPLLFVAKAVILAAASTPEINASWDDAAGEIVLKHYVNLGIAAATERGLIVPNVKDADALSLLELARAMAALTETARAGRTTPGDMSGGTFTITNVGVFGVDTGTPILNPGESGILAFGAVRRMPWVVGSGGDERIEPRWVTQLGVSFDHRIVDGQQGSQFLSDVASILRDPGLALL